MRISATGPLRPDESLSAPGLGLKIVSGVRSHISGVKYAIHGLLNRWEANLAKNERTFQASQTFGKNKKAA